MRTLPLVLSAMISLTAAHAQNGFMVSGQITAISPPNAPAANQLVLIEDSTGNFIGTIPHYTATDASGQYNAQISGFAPSGVLRVSTTDCQGNTYVERHPYAFGAGTVLINVLDNFAIVCAAPVNAASGPLAQVQGWLLDPNGMPWSNSLVLISDSGFNGNVFVQGFNLTDANGYYGDSLNLADTAGQISLGVFDCNGGFTVLSTYTYAVSALGSLQLTDTLVTSCVASGGFPFSGVAFVEGWLLGNATATGAWANELVHIDVTSGGQTYSYATSTDALGYYADSIPLFDSIGTLEVYVVDCAGQVVGSTYNYMAGPNGLVFTDTLTAGCLSGGNPSNCIAEFVVDTVNSFNGQVVLWNTSSGFSNIGNAQFVWDFGDGNTSNQAFPSHQYAQAGMYEVCLLLITTDPQTGAQCFSNYCDSLGMDSLGNLIYKGVQTGFQLTVLNPATIGVGENVLEQVRPFPNPANEFVQISGLTEAVDYRLIDGFGRTVAEGRIGSDGRIDVQSFASGIYVLQLNDGSVQAAHRLLLN